LSDDKSELSNRAINVSHLDEEFYVVQVIRGLLTIRTSRVLIQRNSVTLIDSVAFDYVLWSFSRYGGVYVWREGDSFF